MTTITASTTGAQGVAEVIATFEKPIVFGMPGGHTVQIYDALRDHQDTVESVLVREESIGTVMAEAYGRLSGRVAVVMAQGAWVLGAGGIGVMEAHLGSSPMVVLIDTTEGGTYSHHGPYQSGFGGYGAYDLPAAMAAITKRTFVATDPVQAVQMTQLAAKHALEGEPGPVAVVFHSDALLNNFTEADATRVFIDRNYLSPVPTTTDAAIADAAAAISGSERPVVVAGNGVRDDAGLDALLTFAEALDIPVATTTSGKSVFAEDHPLAAGVMGSFGQNSANTIVGDADLIIAVGTKLGSTDTIDEKPELINAGRQTIVQIDVEALNINWTHPVAHGLLGRVSDILPRLTAAATGVAAGGRMRVAQVRERVGYFEEIAPSDPGARVVNPRQLARTLGETLPADAVVMCDAGENRIFMLHDYQTRQNGVLMQPNGGGGMGYAVPAALAATYTHPDRQAVAVTGDGGYAMSLHGLMTAVENKRKLLVVVMDNQALGWVKHGQGERPFLADFAPFDLGAIAAAIGCTAITATSDEEVRTGVAAACENDGVSVLVVKTNLTESYLTIQTTMAGVSHEQVASK
ncbi:thiamine pyrophosphate-binding protein [Georgenia sp. EYE_87]|uniref:thiamine pyrophosphate-binding protein n=1 Tax=Georgenia sp. EYE_87 TaxID=2853448 RepID=UPI002005D539|nr:thiamine pyrophosphate-binding protein [Georgenia sp. EYE_87]MCK6210060.1 thiamine pyrophosphate-binding protein [Georgenia sp. EYE_87]